jgi:putative MFS transporter
MSNLAARIERIPFNRFHGSLLFIGGLGYSFDGLDGAVVSFVLPVLKTQWTLTPIQIGLVSSFGFVGVFVGALSAGLLGDSIGRKSVMMYSLVVYCAASVVSAFCHDFSSFVAARTVAGAGLGAESAIIAPFLSEFVPSGIRGRFVGSLSAFFSFGFVSAALLGYFIIPLSDDAWRWVLVMTAVPIVMLMCGVALCRNRLVGSQPSGGQPRRKSSSTTWRRGRDASVTFWPTCRRCPSRPSKPPPRSRSLAGSSSCGHHLCAK